MITDQQLLDLNARGLIPGPEESEEQFQERVKLCLNPADKISNIEELSELFDGAGDSDIAGILSEAHQLTSWYYDTKPDWVPVFFSRYRLAPWHGGCSWILQLEEDMPLIALLQLRRAFVGSSTYLKFYHRDELVAHELAHVGRMAFTEPAFEEILAYQTASSRVRRWFSPIVQSPKEAFIFMGTVMLSVFTDIFALFSGGPFNHPYIFGARMLPVGILSIGLWRLWRRQRQFIRCLRYLRTQLSAPHAAHAFIYRLTDKEIVLFATTPPQDLSAYTAARDRHSLRWRLLNLAYFQPTAS